MAITSFTTSVNNKTNAIAFKIILKKFQIASAAYVKAPKQFKKPSLATSGQVSAETDQGVQAGEKSETSLLGGLIGAFGG